MSGLSIGKVAGARCFLSSRPTDDWPSDALGHGDHIATLVTEANPLSQLLIARIFDGQRNAPVERVVAGLDWLVVSGAQVINMSFGMRTPSLQLIEACERASAAGVILVASAPARGSPVFPAQLSCCLSVSGDARCTESQWSWLGLLRADFGANPLLSNSLGAPLGGSSFACARLSGIVARIMAQGQIEVREVVNELRTAANYIGPEQRA